MTMKQIFLLSVITLVNVLPVRGTELEVAGTDQDCYLNQTLSKVIGCSVAQEKLTKDLSVYQIPVFTGENKNRNHFDDRPEGILTPVKALVLHYTVCNFEETISLFTENKPDGRVSAHYVITQIEPEHHIPGGKIIQVVRDDKRAWHAGISSWRDIKNLNGTSIGIENVNKGWTGTLGATADWAVYDDRQIESLGLLSQAIVRKYNINPLYVVGHSDIAPSRKQDPGILFPWGKLHDSYGVGAWLTEGERSPSYLETTYVVKEKLPTNINIGFFTTYLKKIGYEIEPAAYLNPEIQPVVSAFKSHFSQNQKPENYSGDVIGSDEMIWAYGLVAKYEQGT